MAKKLSKEEREKLREQKEHEKRIEKHRKELLKKKKKQDANEKKLAVKRAREELEAQKAIWIASTQTCSQVCDVINSIIVTMDKRYLKIIEVVPQNFEMMSILKQNNIGNAFGGLLNVVPFRVQFKCFSRKGDADELVRAMKKSMSNETNDVCVGMQEDYLELIRNTARTVGVKRRFFVIIEHQDNAVADGTNFNDIVVSLESFAAMIRSRLMECGNTVLPTGDTDMGVNSILYEILNRRMAETIPFREHANEVFRKYEADVARGEAEGKKAALISANEFIAPAWMDFTHYHYCVVDGKFYSFYFMESDSFPQPTTWTGWLGFFINYSEGVDVDIFVDHIPVDKVRENVARQQRFNVTKKQNSETTDSYDMQNRLASGSYVMQAMAAHQEYFEVSLLFTVCADSLEELQYNSENFVKAARAQNYRLRNCNFRQETAFYSALPLCNLAKELRNKSWHNMMTEGAASLYPFLSFELQDPHGIMMGTNNRNNSLVSIDLFDTSRHANANVSIVGQSGYGKTYTAQLLAVRERLQGIQVFIITPIKGYEDYKRVCDKIQGQYLSMGPGTPYSINIFDITAPDNEVVDVGSAHATSLLAQKIQSLHTFFTLICKDITYEEVMRLEGYIYKAYAKYGITDDNDSIYEPGTRTYRQMPLLGDVYDLLKGESGMERVRHILEPYVNGAHKEFNRPTNVDLSNKYICFDMGGLNGDDLCVALFVSLDYVWRKIKEDKGTRKAVFIDEIWKLIGVEGNDLAANYCIEIFKTIRAYGGSACSMTQDITDFFKLKNGAYGKGIISASDTKICLRLDEGELVRMQDVMNLSETEIDQIPRFPRGTGLLVTGSARVEVKFKASEKEDYVISTDPKIARKEREANIARRNALKNLQKQIENDNPDIEINAEDVSEADEQT